MCDPITAYTGVFNCLAGHVLSCLHDGLLIYAGSAAALLAVIALVRVSAASRRYVCRRERTHIADSEWPAHKSYSARFPIG